MDSKALGASIAYLDALKRATQAPKVDEGTSVGAAGQGGQSFAELLQDVAEDAIKTTRKAEMTSVQAAARQADLVDVVTAVSNAETTLESVVAVRDRVVQAYQDILRMPI